MSAGQLPVGWGSALDGVVHGAALQLTQCVQFLAGSGGQAEGRGGAPQLPGSREKLKRGPGMAWTTPSPVRNSRSVTHVLLDSTW